MKSPTMLVGREKADISLFEYCVSNSLAIGIEIRSLLLKTAQTSKEGVCHLRGFTLSVETANGGIVFIMAALRV